MNSMFIFLLLLIYIKQLQGFSEEYYDCLNPDKTVNSNSDCTSIKIPDSEGYKCCSMKITNNKKSFYNCFPLETNYTTNQKGLKDYMSKRSVAFLFGETEGEMEIECPNAMKLIENYEKVSDEYLSCYNSHIKGVKNEDDCTKNDIPTKEGGKCCLIETSQINNFGKIIEDKRCYIIKDEYFTKEKNFNNYLLDESKSKSLDQITNINITIKCKNYETFFFQGNSKGNKQTLSSTAGSNEDNQPLSPSTNLNDDGQSELIRPKKEQSESGVKAWAIILIILGSILLIGIIIVIIVVYYKKRNKPNKDVEITGDNSRTNVKI